MIFVKQSFHLVSTFILSLLIFLAFSCTSVTKTNLKKEILLELDKSPGEFALVYIDLADNSRSIFYNERTSFHAASTMKTPVMFELFKLENKGELNLQDSILVINQFRSIVDSSLYSMDIGEDSEEILYQQIGKKCTYLDLNYEMITKSSNLATNILIEKVGAQNVTNSLRQLGARDIQVLRGVEDLKAYEKGLSNSTSALDLALIFEKMGKRKLIDSTYSEKMIEILFDQKFNEIIPSGLPDAVKVAHKTGSITNIMHDSALVFPPEDKGYVLILLSGSWDSEDIARQTLVKVSKMIYEYHTLN